MMFIKHLLRSRAIPMGALALIIGPVYGGKPGEVLNYTKDGEQWNKCGPVAQGFLPPVAPPGVPIPKVRPVGPPRGAGSGQSNPTSKPKDSAVRKNQTAPQDAQPHPAPARRRMPPPGFENLPGVPIRVPSTAAKPSPGPKHPSTYSPSQRFEYRNTEQDTMQRPRAETVSTATMWGPNCTWKSYNRRAAHHKATCDEGCKTEPRKHWVCGCWNLNFPCAKEEIPHEVTDRRWNRDKRIIIPFTRICKRCFQPFDGRNCTMGTYEKCIAEWNLRMGELNAFRKVPQDKRPEVLRDWQCVCGNMNSPMQFPACRTTCYGLVIVESGSKKTRTWRLNGCARQRAPKEQNN